MDEMGNTETEDEKTVNKLIDKLINAQYNFEMIRHYGGLQVCDDCRYSVPIRLTKHTNGQYRLPATGTCRFNPPTVDQETGVGLFPKIHMDSSGCSKFEGREHEYPDDDAICTEVFSKVQTYLEAIGSAKEEL